MVEGLFTCCVIDPRSCISIFVLQQTTMMTASSTQPYLRIRSLYSLFINVCHSTWKIYPVTSPLLALSATLSMGSSHTTVGERINNRL